MFLSQWAAAFRDGGGFAAVKLPIGNYNAPYLYFLAAISYLPIPDLYLIKLFSILFDVVLAWGGFRLVRHFAPERPNRPLLCFCLLLLLPTVILKMCIRDRSPLEAVPSTVAEVLASSRRRRASVLTVPTPTLAAEALTTQTVERTAVTSAVRRSLAGCIMGRFLQFQSNTRPEGGALASRV